MPTVTLTPAATADDGHIFFTSLVTTDGLRLGDQGPSFYYSYGFVRYASVGIPKGSTINSATLNLTPMSNGSNTISCVIKGIAADNVSTPSTTSDVSSPSRRHRWQVSERWRIVRQIATCRSLRRRRNSH